MSDTKKITVDGGAGQLGFIFFMAYVGAAAYFISQSSGAFLNVVWALIKAVAWPAFLIFHAMQGIGV
ncbi:hypothetical protein H7142_03735 [Candidatus Saccharibacteria bacterium]|nr:hypothetical protein [Candidatus Saccharibacteria bacterium]